MFPITTAPISSLMLKMFVTESGTINWSGTFFSVHTTTESVPLIAIDVWPKDYAALNAYSI